MVEPLLESAGASVKLLWVLGAYRDDIGMSPARTNEVQQLLREGACVNDVAVQQSHFIIRQKKPLHYAVSQKCASPDVVQCLLVHGADVNATDQESKTALHCCIERNPGNHNAGIMELLINSKADLNAVDAHQKTPLHYAIESFETMKFLLDKGSDANAADQHGEAALHHALRNQAKPDVIKLLLERHANIGTRNKGGVTALELAAGFHCSPAIVELLLDQKASVNSSDRYGKTAPHWALEAPGPQASAEVARVILENGADVNGVVNYALAIPQLSRDKCIVRTALLWAVEQKAAPAIIELLLEKSADVHAQDECGRTAIQYAVEQKAEPAIIELLLRGGAEVDAGLFGYAVRSWIDLASSKSAVDLLAVHLAGNLKEGQPSIVAKSVFESVDVLKRPHGTKLELLANE